MYMSPGVYPITLTMETEGYCVRTLEMDGSQAVEILPVPVAAIDVTPNPGGHLEPRGLGGVLGEQNVDCYYSFGDGGELKGATASTSTTTEVTSSSPKRWSTSLDAPTLQAK